MAYKIIKYAGKHTIKDTKTGESAEIDIKKFLKGGTATGNKKKELSKDQVKDVSEATGIEFTNEGANSLFVNPDDIANAQSNIPELDLGRYKDVGYFNIQYNNGEYNISPTNRNPANAAKYKEYLTYIQKQNPNAKINRRGHDSGYLPFNRRLEYGGYLPKYANGAEFGCPEWDIECQERQKSRNNFQNKIMPDYLIEGLATEQPKNYQGLGPVAIGQEGNINQGMSRPSQINPQQGIITEDTRQPVQSVNAGITAQPMTIDYSAIQTPDISASLKDSVNQLEGTNIQDAPNQNYNMFNPYAGVDIPTAAYTLGQSIKNKDTLGTIGSGLKVATGLARNVVSGLGQANRYNQVMEDYYKNQRDNKNPTQYFADGGKKKDEDFATGEYMQGVDNENIHEYNAEVEDGEYFQTNEGDIAEIVGKKHSEGGEKIQMEEDDRVLSDKLKLGSKVAKELAKKYDLKLKAKDTYSTVLDKFKRKSKLKGLIEEEAEILKKISEQDKVEDTNTRAFNIQVLTKKQEEIAAKKDPIEEQRKGMFDELFDIQEESKVGSKESNNEGEYQYGGEFESLAKEYNIPIDRAKELIQKFTNGGKQVPKYENGVKIGDIDPKTGKKVTKEEARKKVESGEWEDLGSGQYIERGAPGTGKIEGQALQSYRQTWDKNKFPRFEDYVNAAEQWKRDNPNWNRGSKEVIPGIPDKFFYTEERPISSIEPRGIQPMQVDTTIKAGDINIPKSSPINTEDLVINNEDDIRKRNTGIMGAYLFPPESPLPPSSLQGTIKPERRFDRVRPTEITVEPYLQDMRDREQAQVQSLEGLSPNVRAAVLANMRASNQSQESNIRNQIDAQNMQSQERALYTNAQIQAREENASEADRLAYEKRQYRAQELTNNDINNYYNQLQALNKQRFMDVENLNLVNATNEDVAYVPGRGYVRKNTDQEIMDRYLRSKGLR